MKNSLSKEQLQACIILRKSIHKEPETAFEEKKTSKKLIDFLQKNSPPDRLVKSIGGFGFLAFYEGNSSGKTLLFRSELDALPIRESNKFEHKSIIEGKAHKCGHDGHMSILAALACLLSKRNFPGTIILLFQAAEETGEGALAMIEDKKWLALNLQVDQSFALHNLPSYELNQIILRNNIFSAASTGMIIKLKGKPSHAAHPMDGVNPSLAISQMIQSFYEIPQMNSPIEQASLITPVGFKAGMKAFGTSAHFGEVYATLRTYDNQQMKKLNKLVKNRIQAIAKTFKLNCTIKWVEGFTAVENNNEAVNLVEETCKEMKLDYCHKETPFSWSEDYGQFSKHFPSCMFGIGAGKSCPQLHTEDYDFPDELINTASCLFFKLVFKYNQIHL